MVIKTKLVSAVSVTNSIHSEKGEILVKWDSSFCEEHTVASEHATNIPLTSSFLMVKEEGPTWETGALQPLKGRAPKGQQPQKRRVEGILSIAKTCV